jgi:hypothetical protein
MTSDSPVDNQNVDRPSRQLWVPSRDTIWRGAELESKAHGARQVAMQIRSGDLHLGGAGLLVESGRFVETPPEEVP